MSLASRGGGGGGRAHSLAVSAGAAGGINVEVHGLGAVLVLEVEELRDDELRHSGHQLDKQAHEPGQGRKINSC